MREQARTEAGDPASAERAHDRFAQAVVDSADVDQFLQRFLEILAEVASVTAVVVRMVEGDRLRPRAAIGMEEDIAAAFSMPSEGYLREESSRPLFRYSPIEAAPFRKEELARRGVEVIYGLPLGADPLLGVVYLCAPADHRLSSAQQELLDSLATRAAAAISKLAEYERLREGIRSRDEILGIVAHDLRNPLNVIGLAANTLLLRDPDASTRRPVERILRGMQRAERLIQDLLSVTAIESGRFSIETGRVETADTVLAALESQQSLAESASIIIAPDLSPDLPPIQADEERILEVFENLVGNAVKFTNSGGSVSVGASAGDGEVLFWVKDNGPGISAEVQPHLFDRFWQATKRGRRGTGLGLAICKGIVEAHGGRIWADTEEGRGTTMFFTVPALGKAPEAEDLEVASILLVDDRADNLTSLKAILDRPDYRLVTALSGEEALRLALRERFSVALVDVAMPRMNGLEVASHMKELERSREIPIIFITAFGDDPEEIHRAYAAGGADYLVKPLDPEIVRKKVAVFVGLSRRRRAIENAKQERDAEA